MTPMSMDDIERHLEALPREAWDRPTPPPPPWPSAAPAERAPSRRRGWLVLRPLVAAAASVVLVGAGIGAGLLLAGDDSGAPGGGPGPAAEPLRVELQPVGGRGEGATGLASIQSRPGGRAELRLAGLRPSAEGDFYELWLLGESGELVSLGSVRVPESGRARFDVQIPVDPERFQFLDLSREPADGDPSHSTISVLRGPVT